MKFFVLCLAVILTVVHDVHGRTRNYYPYPQDATVGTTCMKSVNIDAMFAYPDFDEAIYDSEEEFSQLTEMPKIIRVIADSQENILCFGFHEDACNNWNTRIPEYLRPEEVVYRELQYDEVVLYMKVYYDSWREKMLGVYIETNYAQISYGNFDTNFAVYISDRKRPIIGMHRFRPSYGTYLKVYMSCSPVNDNSAYEEIYTRVIEAFKQDISAVIAVAEEYETGRLANLVAKSCSIYRSTGNATYEKACHLAFMVQQLKLYKKTVEGLTNHLPRSLLRTSKFDSSILLAEVNRARQFNSVLKQIGITQQTVEGTTRTVVQTAQATGDYFSNLASFDKGIAQQDKLFISGRLTQLRKGTSDLTDDISTRFKRLFETAIALTAAEMAETAVRLAVAVAANFNPLKVIFGGPDINTVLDLVKELAGAVRNFAKAVTLTTQVDNFIEKLKDIQRKFSVNRNQLTELKKLVDTFDTATNERQLDMASNFVTSYGNYAPNVTMQDLSFLIDLLQNVVATGCDLVEGATSSTAVIAATVLDNVRQDCIYLPALVTQLGSYFEDTFAFQFDLVDALTNMVRGEIAHSLSAEFQNIVNKDTYDVKLAAIGTILVEINFQKTALARCNMLEYQQGGARPAQCSSKFIEPSSIPEIIAYQGNTGSSESTRSVFLPTTSLSSTLENRTPFINITQLIETREVNFHLPIDNTNWMKKYHWIPNDYQYSYNKEYSYRIKSIEAFIPGLKYQCSGRTDYKIGIDLISGHPTRMFPQEAPPQYTMPGKLFRFEYTVGRQCTHSNSIVNYAVREDNSAMTTKSSQSVCVESTGDYKGDSDELFPSIFSSWTLRVRDTEPGCTLVSSGLNYHPLITFNVKIEEVFGQGINECWPDGSRCQSSSCVNGDLSFYCT